MNINPADKLRDNDPRVTYTRVLTIEEVLPAGDGKPARVAARESGYGRRVYIACSRIFPDSGTPRRSGFTHLPPPELSPAIKKLLGQEIVLRRGSRGRATGQGCERTVCARLDRVDGIMVFATLLEDDPMASLAPFKANESGLWHGLSFIDNLEQ